MPLAGAWENKHKETNSQCDTQTFTPSQCDTQTITPMAEQRETNSQCDTQTVTTMKEQMERQKFPWTNDTETITPMGNEQKDTRSTWTVIPRPHTKGRTNRNKFPLTRDSKTISGLLQGLHWRLVRHHLVVIPWSKHSLSPYNNINYKAT